MSYNVKNYTEQGGDVTHIGGSLVIEDGATVTGFEDGLPSVSSTDNGDVLTVVSGEWAKAAPAAELPAVSGSDNGNVLRVVEGSWAKASLPQGVAVADAAGDAPTATEFKALLDSLRGAGLIASST